MWLSLQTSVTCTGVPYVDTEVPERCAITQAEHLSLQHSVSFAYSVVASAAPAEQCVLSRQQQQQNKHLHNIVSAPCIWHLQVLSWQSDVLSHKQQNKRLQEDNQRLQNQMLATGERLERMAQDASLDLSKEVLKLQRQLAGTMLGLHQTLCVA